MLWTLGSVDQALKIHGLLLDRLKGPKNGETTMKECVMEIWTANTKASAMARASSRTLRSAMHRDGKEQPFA